MSDPRRFTIEEANALLPEVVRLTEGAAARLQALDALEVDDEDDLREVLRRQQGIAQDWDRAVTALGVLPKGLFVVDFVSRGDPSVLYCWAFGEPRVAHQHRESETFDDRVPVPGWSLQETVQ